MELLTLASSVASLLSLGISLFVAHRVVRLGNQVRVYGNNNVAVGGNAGSAPGSTRITI